MLDDGVAPANCNLARDLLGDRTLQDFNRCSQLAGHLYTWAQGVMAARCEAVARLPACRSPAQPPARPPARPSAHLPARARPLSHV